MTLEQEAAALVETARAFHARAERHRAFRSRWRRPVSADKREAIAAAAGALETVAADLRAMAVETRPDPIGALVDQARALGLVP